MSDPLIRLLRPGEAQAAVPALAAVLLDSIRSGSPTGFLAGAGLAEAEQFWAEIVADIPQGRTVVLVAEDDQGICGTLYMKLSLRPTERHRGRLSKLLVLSRARRKGAARGMLSAVETAARALGRSLLLIATAAESDGEKLCVALGWTEAGFVPGYALAPDGRPVDTAFYYKALV